ncbi:MAG TPA: tail fiber domain-containing protein, partial [Casimicrobium sp.]|nr:tail fiber domain-containing protein [Casimicrobium sp.]
NAFGAPGVIGTTDAQPLTVKSGGAAVSLLTAGNNGLRITESTSTTVGSTFGIGVHPQTTFTNTLNGSPANSVAANIVGATISGGGFLDFAGPSGLYTNYVGGHFGTVGGGLENIASGAAGVVSGGRLNASSGAYAVVGGGSGNNASGGYSTVSGGYGNTASGIYSTAIGGANNTAGGAYSVAMGQRAKTNGYGSFQFADAHTFDFSSGTHNTFRVRATGGVRFVTDIDGTGAITWSCAAFAGAGWSCSSDRNLKQGLKKLDGKKVLAKLAAMPVYQWQPKGQNAHVKHVGPMAQDFMKAFGVGDDDKMIGMQDADGVALAAIQGLNQIVKAKDAKIAALEKANAIMLKKLAAIERKLGL